METALLRTFTAVVRTGNLTAAARDLGYVQSTVTGHLQTLERRLQARLLDRLPTGTVLTDAGRRLLPLAEELLAVENRIRSEVATPSDPLTGQVRLAASESLCAYRLAGLIASLRQDTPGIQLTLTPAATKPALAALRNGTVDAALLLEPAVAAEDLTITQVGTEPLLLIAPPIYGDPAPNWGDLAGHDFLLLEEGCSYSDDTARRLAAAGQSGTRRTRFGSVETIKRCVTAGLGLTVLPAVTCVDELQSGVLKAKPAPNLPSWTVLIATHPRRSHSPATCHVLDRLARLWPTTSPALSE